MERRLGCNRDQIIEFFPFLRRHSLYCSRFFFINCKKLCFVKYWKITVQTSTTECVNNLKDIQNSSVIERKCLLGRRLSVTLCVTLYVIVLANHCNNRLKLKYCFLYFRFIEHLRLHENTQAMSHSRRKKRPSRTS